MSEETETYKIAEKRYEQGKQDERERILKRFEELNEDEEKLLNIILEGADEE